MKPSTREFIHEAKNTQGYSLFDFIHGYIYGRWPYLYISIGIGEHPIRKTFSPLINLLTRLVNLVKKDNFSTDTSSSSQTQKITFADTYHGKVLPMEAARQLVMVNEAINLQNLEQIIPYQRARDIILRNPEHIVVMECPCRSARPDPCLPLEVCLIIGEPFASFVIEHHPRRARWITQQQAVDIITAENERGHVHHAFFKDAMFNRFFAICNCCSCCCGAMQAHRGGTPMLASSGYVTRKDEGLCEGCGDCIPFCQFGALSMNGDTANVDPNLCMGCGVCNDKCIHGALSLYRDEMKGEPLEICEFMELPSLKPATKN
jgi:ferredoxin